MSDLISRQNVLDVLRNLAFDYMFQCGEYYGEDERQLTIINAKKAIDVIEAIPSAKTEIIRCKDCKHWKQQINYQGTLLPFGFCESEDMWRSLYGETTEVEHIDTDDNHYCGFAERRTDE